MEFLSNMNVKPPFTNVKPPYSRLHGDGSGHTVRGEVDGLDTGGQHGVSTWFQSGGAWNLV